MFFVVLSKSRDFDQISCKNNIMIEINEYTKISNTRISCTLGI